MLRQLATLVFLVPLSLNGLWMVCAEEEPPEAQALSAAGSPEVTAECGEVCPIKNISPGAICIISSSGEGSSLAAIFFGVAPPPATETLSAEFHVRESVPERPEIYFNPTLADLDPPPKA